MKETEAFSYLTVPNHSVPPT